MSNPYIIRGYQPADFDRYARLRLEAERQEPTGRCAIPEVIRENLGHPSYSPERDLFVVEIAKNMVGYLDVAPERSIKRVILDGWVHPEHRRRGLATKLLSCVMQRAQELGAEIVHVNIAEGNEVAQRVLPKLAFRYVRRFLEFRLDIADFRWSDIDQPALKCRHLRHGEEDKLTQLQNRAFTGTWGYNPNTVEEIAYRTSSSISSPEDIILAYAGNKLIGYCWTGVAGEGGTPSKERGRILMLGVEPNERGRGVGKRVLLAGLAHLRSKGLQVAELTVDSENKVACALYQSLGFEVHASSLWYERAIN